VILRSGILLGAALPAAILATMFALYLARADAPPAAERPEATTPSGESQRLRRQAIATGVISLSLWAAVVFTTTGIGPDILDGLILPMGVGAALFSALAASALRQGRAGGSVPMTIRVIGRTATTVSLVIVLLTLGGTVVLWVLMRHPF
jgi:hypothetical protein